MNARMILSVYDPAGVVWIPFAGVRTNKSYPIWDSSAFIAAVIEDCDMFSSAAALAIEPSLSVASTYRSCFKVKFSMGIPL